MGRCIGESLAMNTTLQHLDLSGTVQQPNIDSRGVKFIAESLRMPSALRQLTTGNLEEDHFSLIYLNLAYNRIDDNVAKGLASELKQNSTIKQIILKGNFLGPAAGRTFADMLCGNKTFKKVDLSENSLDPTAGLAFAEMLKVNKGLRYLNLSANRIGSRYVTEESMKLMPGRRFAESIPACRTLEHLDLGGCGFEQEEERFIISAVTNVDLEPHQSTSGYSQPAA